MYELLFLFFKQAKKVNLRGCVWEFLHPDLVDVCYETLKIHQALHQERKEKHPKIQLPTPFKDCFSSPSLLAVFSGLNKAADFSGDQVSFEHSMEPAPPPASADWQCHDHFSLKSFTFQLFFSIFSKTLATAMAWVARVPRLHGFLYGAHQFWPNPPMASKTILSWGPVYRCWRGIQDSDREGFCLREILHKVACCSVGPKDGEGTLAPAAALATEPSVCFGVLFCLFKGQGWSWGNGLAFRSPIPTCALQPACNSSTRKVGTGALSEQAA